MTTRPHRPDRGRRASRSLVSARLVACAVLALVLFDYPLLAVLADGGSVLGVPVLPLYVFTAWGLVVVLAARLARRG